ncbi:hypothetical protein PVK06_039716 [Gossypium arboreum]|uniref:Uncharacterized protein n=1 Tax=Gossypium arboreum TaxID=29729 RepID=A0ABR0N3M8_GOSAR|nr:hypothetical protein PVK06_039716 [Gossypium arboreum]
MVAKQQNRISTNFTTTKAKTTLYWEYVKKCDIALKKALQNNFTKEMPIFPMFPKELLSGDDDEDDKPVTAHKHSKDPARDE